MYSSPSQHVGHPTKVVWLIALFSNSECLFMQHFLNGFTPKFDNTLLHRSKNELNYVLGWYGG